MLKKISLIINFIYIYILLIFFDKKLCNRGFNETFKNYSIKYFNEIPHEHMADKTVAEVEKFFFILNIVCTWYPKKADCIHKTLIGYRIMRKKFLVPVEMVIGVQKFPLQAHAWLKIRDHNLFEDEDTSMYKVILSSNTCIKEDLEK